MEMEDACRLIAERASLERVATKEELQRLKLIVAKELGLKIVPSDLDVLRSIRGRGGDSIREVLRRKAGRSLSGVTVITVAVPPYNCPHGSCAYCPGGPAWNAPKSYTGEEHIVKLSQRYSYDPGSVIRDQVKKLEDAGHTVDKIELIMVGGTFTALPLHVQRSLVKRCLDELNGVESSSLEEGLRVAEGAERRVVGMTAETKPEYAKYEHANRLLEMGFTRVELGVQTLDDWSYSVLNRGHTLRDVVESTRVLKDLAFKVTFHVMPGLPESSPERDIEVFRELFTNDAFKPDALKIYPTLVLPGTQLHKWWLKGWYRPYTADELVKVLVESMRYIPVYVRVNRIQREIPPHAIIDGNRLGNLRQLVEREAARRGIRCRCIRCREVGRQGPKYEPRPEHLRLMRLSYEASGGIENFISFEDVANDVLIGFVRLRIPSEPLRPELRGAALVRELHVYGQMVPVGEGGGRGWQHRGVGSRLLFEAERVASEEFGLRKVVVISGVGVREYYYSRGYVLDGPYVSKTLQ
ncbi:MAG: tRNA uridine(34) 5-carboxymethylaminomethyl modification radical SAM/GNAT enzyme Elp3 [Aigarchaeota archaeon]|nr:tRNA uridine(34) 5-carboxymethylaminomethyl modification radical SAM/GNAT enzyme Elp3 [Aigarchaeota archaeon]MDW8093095.1 tRNA uridine(34) 5-carboxymethylaminomethyl modification radical SAM/GNAT enzyme Elp3 [Nitrososphaerota archaeon]